MIKDMIYWNLYAHIAENRRFLGGMVKYGIRRKEEKKNAEEVDLIADYEIEWEIPNTGLKKS
jgi:hypothetical protein